MGFDLIKVKVHVSIWRISMGYWFSHLKSALEKLLKQVRNMDSKNEHQLEKPQETPLWEQIIVLWIGEGIWKPLIL